MGALVPNYPDPVLVCDTTGDGLQPGILDIQLPQSNIVDYPPVLHIWLSPGNGATVTVYGALRVSSSASPALVRPTDVSSGGYTASDFYDLIPGLRFYQIEVTGNTGQVIVEAGFGQLLRMMNNAPQGT